MTEDTSPEISITELTHLGNIGDADAIELLIKALKSRTDSLLENRDYSISSQNSLDWGFSGSAEFPRAEVSPGSRAKCMASRQKIMKGELRIAVEKFGVEDGEVWINIGYILADNFGEFFDNMKMCLSLGNRIDPTPWPRAFLDTENWENTVHTLIENSQREIKTKHRKKTYPPLAKEKLHELNELFGGTIGSYHHIVKALVRITEANIKGKEQDNIMKFLKSGDQGMVMMGASMLKGILEK